MNRGIMGIMQETHFCIKNDFVSVRSNMKYIAMPMSPMLMWGNNSFSMVLIAALERSYWKVTNCGLIDFSGERGTGMSWVANNLFVLSGELKKMLS